MGVWQRLPVIRTALLDDPPVPRGCCNHRGALSWGDTLVTVRRLSPGSPASSTPHRSLLGHPHPTRFSLRHRDLWDWENAFSYTIKKTPKTSYYPVPHAHTFVTETPQNAGRRRHAS